MKQLIGLYENKQPKKQVQFEKKNESSDVVEGTVKDKVAFYENKRNNSSSSSSGRQSKKSEVNHEKQEGYEQATNQDTGQYEQKYEGSEQYYQREEENLAMSKNAAGNEEQKHEEEDEDCPEVSDNEGLLAFWIFVYIYTYFF